MNNFDPNQQAQQPMQQPMPPQMPPMAPRPPKAPLFNNDLLGILSCGAGLASFGLGIIASIIANSVYGANTAGSTNVKIVSGPSPIFGFIINFIALILGALAVVIAIKVGSDRIRSGAPRGTIATLGLVFGIAAVLVCFVALFFTGCSMISNCSYVNYARSW